MSIVALIILNSITLLAFCSYCLGGLSLINLNWTAEEIDIIDAVVYLAEWLGLVVGFVACVFDVTKKRYVLAIVCGLVSLFFFVELFLTQ